MRDGCGRWGKSTQRTVKEEGSRESVVAMHGHVVHIKMHRIQRKKVGKRGMKALERCKKKDHLENCQKSNFTNRTVR